jgi:hypothetical protein
MIREVVTVFAGLIGMFVLGVLAIAVVDGAYQPVMDMANIQPGDPMADAIPYLTLFATVVMFSPCWIGLVYLIWFALRNIWREAEVLVG